MSSVYVPFDASSNDGPNADCGERLGGVMMRRPAVTWQISSRRVVAALLVWLAVGTSAAIEAQVPGRWIGTWATGPVSLPVPDDRSVSQDDDAPPQINDQTVRQVVHTSIGGSHLRVLFTNQYGTEPLDIRGIGRSSRYGCAGCCSHRSPADVCRRAVGHGRTGLDAGERRGRARRPGRNRSGRRRLSSWGQLGDDLTGHHTQSGALDNLFLADRRPHRCDRFPRRHDGAVVVLSLASRGPDADRSGRRRGDRRLDHRRDRVYTRYQQSLA